MATDKEEEIAKLEEQLKKLREEADQGEEGAVDDGAQAAPEAEVVVPEAMFLSEGWKEAEESEGSGMLTKVLGAIGLAVVLAIFSQVPIGQDDYSKYSEVKASTGTIDLGDINRARNAGDL
ncbi:unnamed protein product [Cylindrotheca closterium]|uniref:Uncharacterized protein n=1 Tax=Cylindrotheca closterium TaxID=2856 RepID=A0AAD2CR33_9STRA|nr:unnamed protein product [Cylindrotheca closterium]